MVNNKDMCKVITSGYCPYADGVDEDVKSCADCPWYNPEAEQRFFEEVTRMIDREEVLKGLEHHRHLEASRNELGHDECFDCPYRPYGEDTCASLDRMIDDVLELLKEQEAVEPILKRKGKSKMYNDYVCPVCDNEVVYGQCYCSECGKPFLWEGR